ncbi:MAG TPA: hypothetical protein VNL96_05875, partial [Gemmatimonadaceae bacterium]|nr:hypothetical protein [Gemmatimonadaceae bacterium]
GVLSEVVTLHTNCPERPDVDVLVKVRGVPPVRANFSRLALAPGETKMLKFIDWQSRPLLLAGAHVLPRGAVEATVAGQELLVQRVAASGCSLCSVSIHDSEENTCTVLIDLP